MRALLVIVCLAWACALWSEDTSFASQVAATDMTNVDQVLALAQWCRDHQHPVSATKYFHEAIKLDPDNEGARAALGFVRVGDKWVYKEFAPKSALAPDGGGAQSAAVNVPPGPKASAITWDDPIPADPDAANGFISKYIDRLPNVPNDSNDMDVSVATCVDAKYWPSALPRLCKALKEPSFTDLYGASMMVLELGKQGRLREAKALIGPMVKATAHVTDVEDLEAFCWAVAAFKDRRAVPRLIELMEQGPADLSQAAGQAVATIARLPAAGLDAAGAHRWWDENWNRSDEEAAKSQSQDKDPTVAVEAARELLELGDRECVPTAIRCLKDGDAHARAEALDIIAKATGDSWGYNADGDEASRTKVIAHLEAWWKDNHGSFHLPQVAPDAAPAAAKDPCAELVADLGHPEGTVADDAQNNLIHRGWSACPALLDGLASPSVIVRRHCHEILTEITKAAIAYDARGSDQARATGIAAWRAWIDANHPSAPAAAAAQGSGAPAAATQATTGAGGDGSAPAAPAPAHPPQPGGEMPGL